ncbi:multicopper oxidase family protein [Acinetobacter guillouiae]|uniref:multicopper oxidase family protein n=1 Tax=Acinetobacter guillouiae TaxID=106649 RepID=UPI00333FEDFC
MKNYITILTLLAPTPLYAGIQNPPLFNNSNIDSNFVSIDLEVDKKLGEIYNPVTNRIDSVELRQYIDPHNPLANQFVAPTIQIKQGKSLKVNLMNNLPLYEYKKNNGEIEKTPNCRDEHNTIGCINTTNLHTHGLQVNPEYTVMPSKDGKDKGIAADNVFIKINPKEKQDYQFDIPKDHPAGTYWYHAHLHGSTALQVTSGMAGALIIEGNRLPKFDGKSFEQKGDFDVLWKAKKPSKISLNNIQHKISADSNNDLIMVFQQIQYICGDNQKLYKVNCETNEIGHLDGDVEIKISDTDKYKLLSPSGWKKSGRYTSINGNVLGQIDLNQNEFYRWRMIHGGVRDTIGLRVYKLEKPINTQDKPNFIAECQKAAKLNNAINYSIVAQDGLTTNAIQQTNTILLQPGYRYDAIFNFKDAGQYCVVDNDKFPDSFKVNTNIEAKSSTDTPDPDKVLAIVNVKVSSSPTITLKEFLKSKVEDITLSNGQQLDAITQKQIKSDLDNNLITAFTPLDSLQNIESSNSNIKIGQQQLNFNISKVFGISNEKFNADLALPYGNNLNRYLTLNGIDEWTLTSTLAGHPFHIHVNPFQIQSVYKVDGSNNRIGGDITLEKNTNPLFNGLNGVWKDTLFVPTGYEIVVRTKYEKFTGDFVLHCHILDHEDQGMMQNVRICDPNDKDCKTRPFGSVVPAGLHSHAH